MNKLKRYGFALAVIQCVFTFNSATAADYSFASIAGLIEQRVGELVLPEIYNKIGLEITINPLPAKRAQAMATSGTLDGEIMRIWTYGEENPSTIRVPTPYYQLETTAFVRKDSGISILTKEDLSHYKIAKVAGVKHTNNITKGLENVFDTGDTIAIMRMVVNGRVDVALTNTTDGWQVLDNLNISEVVHLEPPLATLDLFHYVHEKHSDIVPLIDKAIKEMTLSGELDELIRKAEQNLISQ